MYYNGHAMGRTPNSQKNKLPNGPTEASQKLNAVRLAMEQIEKQYGRGSIMRFGEAGKKLDISVISAEDLDYLTNLEKQRAERFKVLDEIGAVFKDVSSDKLFSEVTNAVKEVRKERRKK